MNSNPLGIKINTGSLPLFLGKCNYSILQWRDCPACSIPYPIVKHAVDQCLETAKGRQLSQGSIRSVKTGSIQTRLATKLTLVHYLFFWENRIKEIFLCVKIDP